MARFPRAVALGAAHHITQRGVDQQRVFFTDADRRTYLDCLQTYSAPARLRILAYCLMSNHIHLVAIPEEPQSLATALRRTHGRYALYLNSRRHRIGHLWQNRFYSCALDETHLWAALRYVELNPVRARLVTRPEEYAWSSASAHVGTNAPSTLLDWQFYSNSGGRERWTALLAEPEELAAIRALQRGTFTGRPLGSPDFVARLEQELGRPLAPRQGQRSRSESVLAISQ
jgi:putative transposase